MGLEGEGEEDGEGACRRHEFVIVDVVVAENGEF